MNDDVQFKEEILKNIRDFQEDLLDKINKKLIELNADYTKFHNNDYYWDDIKYMENRVISLLAGKAATEIVFNKCDVGCNSDLDRAYELIDRFVDNYCMNGFSSWIRDRYEQSEKVKQNKDDEIIKLINKYYNNAKEILIANRDKLDNLADVLIKNKILFQDEIENILS